MPELQVTTIIIILADHLSCPFSPCHAGGRRALTANYGFKLICPAQDVGLLSLVGMGFRQVRPAIIVTAKIMATQAGLNINRRTGISTQRLEAHYLAGAT